MCRRRMVICFEMYAGSKKYSENNECLGACKIRGEEREALFVLIIKICERGSRR